MIKKADLLFILGGVIIILIFLAAPPETTVYLPYDDEHKEFSAILRKEGKKATEKFCDECHNPEDMPLSENHPPKYRCLFCHKLTPPPVG